MSKTVDLDKPLSDEDREYLLGRARGWEVEENDRRFKKGKFAEDFVEEFKGTNTVAAPPIEPGSDADNPPTFVGQRPHGVDRAVWGGSTGVTEQEAYARTAPEPHAEVGPAPDDNPQWQEHQLSNPESTAAASPAAQAASDDDDDDVNDDDDTVSDDDDDVQVVEVAPEDLTVDELKDELRARELTLEGNKADLVKRLKKALKEEDK